MKQATLIILITLAAIYYFYSGKDEAPPMRSVVQAPPPAPVPRPAPTPPPEPQPVAQPVPTPPPPAPKIVRENSENKKLALRYKIQNGLFVVQGDVVAGAVIAGQNPPEDGLVEMEPFKLWPNIIPYHIQPDVTNPERITQALAMFEGTAVQFVKHTNEDDALVFEVGEKNCLSYVGKVTAKQQVWISPNCKPDDIAHEIMHALGFVHEQNRSDRDSFIDVLPDNIEDEFKYNFDKLPPDFMRVSGLGDFDFQSLMMYPQWMFAKSGRNTMEPKQRDKLIDPQPRLSRGDIDRINRAYRR